MSDTQAGKKCLVHYNDQHIQVRKDFLDLCAYDKSQYNNDTRKSGKTKRDEPNQECMAKILRLLETLTDIHKSHWQHRNEELITKKKLPLKEPAEYRIELAYSTIMCLLYNTYGESTIRNSMAALLQMGYITRYQKNKASIPHYALNIPLLQALLQNQVREDEQLKEEVLNIILSDLDDFLGDDKVLNSTSKSVHSTAKGVNVTPKSVHSTAKGVNVTPNNIVDKKDSNISSKKEEDASLSSPALSIWNTWCEAQGYTLKRDWTKTEQERCLALADMCKEASIDLSPRLMNEVREWAQAKQSFLRNDWALKNLINALPDYFIQINSVVTQPPEVQDLPDLPEEEAEQPVLWSRHPSKIITMIQRGENTIEDHWQELVWVSHSEAREYGYDSPLARRYTPEEIEQYKQLTSQQTACIAQKASSYEHTKRSHTTNAVESTQRQKASSYEPMYRSHTANAVESTR